VAVSVLALAWLSRWRVLASSSGGGADRSGLEEADRLQCVAAHRVSGMGQADVARRGRVPVLWKGVGGSLGASVPRMRAG
jgi:hypothetical protein